MYFTYRNDFDNLVEQKQTTQYVFYIIDSFYAIDNTIYLMLYTLAVERNLHAFLKKTA